MPVNTVKRNIQWLRKSGTAFSDTLAGDTISRESVRKHSFVFFETTTYGDFWNCLALYVVFPRSAGEHNREFLDSLPQHEIQATGPRSAGPGSLRFCQVKRQHPDAFRNACPCSSSLYGRTNEFSVSPSVMHISAHNSGRMGEICRNVYRKFMTFSYILQFI